MCLVDVTGEGQNQVRCRAPIARHHALQLVVGSEDFDLRIFNDTDLLSEFSENEVRACGGWRMPMRAGGDRTVCHGPAGVCIRTEQRRYWPLQRRHQALDKEGWTPHWHFPLPSYSSQMKQAATMISSFDFNLDGVAELVCGWADGRVDVRSERDGTVLFKDEFHAPIAGIAVVGRSSSA